MACGCKKKKTEVPVAIPKPVSSPAPATQSDLEKKNLINKLLKIKG